jgi:hypothetical protein
MRKNVSKVLFATIVIGCAFSCKKTIENAVPTSPVNTALSISDSKPGILRSVTGNYQTRGSQTIYDGQANKDGSNISRILDFFIEKKIVPSPDKRHFTCPYGYGKYMEKGWKYMIGYDLKNNRVTLAPNAAMDAEIVPGSFKVLYAAYDAFSKSFTFQTRFTALEDNGNESEMMEPLVKIE